MIWLGVFLLILVAAAGAPLFAVLMGAAMLGTFSSGGELSSIAVDIYRIVDTPLLVALPLFIALAAEKTVLPRLEKSPWYLPVQTTLWASYAMVMFVFYRTTTRDFIYFQF